MNKIFLMLLAQLVFLSSCDKRQTVEMKESSLFVELPESCPTPDGMAVAPDGNLVLACPNFADTKKPAVLMRITPQGEISKWIDVPTLDATGLAAPMGIAFNDNGDLYVCDNQGWSGSEAGRNQGRLLRLVFNERGELAHTVTVAYGMEHPNGVRVRNGWIYVTQSILSPLSTDRTVSGVYRFSENDRNIAVSNSEADSCLLFTVVTENPDVRYGLDGLDFDKDGNLYVGNFGDASIIKVSFDASGRVVSKEKWAQDTTLMKSVDGICIDSTTGKMYVADFSTNGIVCITPDGKISRIAESPDCDGSNGGLDQPGEPIIWDGRLIVSCFDAVTDSGKVNTSHDKPYTLAEINIKN